MSTILADVAARAQVAPMFTPAPTTQQDPSNQAGYRHPAAYQADGGRVGARHRGQAKGEPDKGTRFIFPEEAPRLFSERIAVRLKSPDKSLFLTQLHYRLLTSKNIRDGQSWVYNTYEGWHKEHPYWSVGTIRRMIKSLRDIDGLIFTTDAYNQRGGDHTLWITINREKLIEMFGDSSDHHEVASDQIDQTPCAERSDALINVSRALPKRSPKKSSQSTTENPTTRARDEATLSPTMGGWVVAEQPFAENGFGSTANPEQPAPVKEFVSATNRSEADPPPTLPAQPPPAIDDPAAALMVAVGISANVAARLARQDGCTVAKVERVIKGWQGGCKRREFDRPLGALKHRLENFEQFCGAEEPQRAYSVEIVDPSNPTFEEDPPAPAPLPNAAAIAPPIVEDALIEHWPMIVATELGTIPELVDSRLIALEGGGYKILIANPGALERVRIGQWAIKRALRGQPFSLAVA